MEPNQVTVLNELAFEMGFLLLGITKAHIDDATISKFKKCRDAGYFGDMGYLEKNLPLRMAPADLHSNCGSVISLICPYLSDNSTDWMSREWSKLQDSSQAYISVYARGMDYHKVLRKKTKELAKAFASTVGAFTYRVAVDSAPILEVELAEKCGLGWRGKNTLLLNKSAGSMFFLAEILLDIHLPSTPKVMNHCGTCQACMTICPTQAFVSPYILDARRCISYLTIELASDIPMEFRHLIGNRIFGCDDCQLICPWNKFAKKYILTDFSPSKAFESPDLLALWEWDEATFTARTQCSPIRRIGYQRWLRNIAVALGNALRTHKNKVYKNHVKLALTQKLPQVSEMVARHVVWALSSGAPDIDPLA
ncbi:MAG: tRNA epoxyqueuosine(34) reductase QueG [Gammaproteobacteria bacterium]|nr:tRNA epoxyqueuosine(34) reductase QueG [Gammaproteobacteria bacterium]